MPPVVRIMAMVGIAMMVAACSPDPRRGASPASPSRAPSASADPCAPWGCEQRARFAAAAAFIGRQPGHIGIVIQDRVTGQVWRGGDPAVRSWAGSTPKLALAVALLEQDRAGAITLDATDTAGIVAMLRVSDNAAADRLWDRYANSASIMDRWQSVYGMTTASYVDGWTRRWGFVKLTPQDLVNLMGYVLDRLNPASRALMIDQMRMVGPPQQWGVWGAGASLHPGVKDGWDYCVEIGETVYRWVTSTVGFVGPGERYVVAAMYDAAPGQTLDHAVHVLTDLVATAFGAAVPAPAVVPNEV